VVANEEDFGRTRFLWVDQVLCRGAIRDWPRQSGWVRPSVAIGQKRLALAVFTDHCALSSGALISAEDTGRGDDGGAEE
jgi:hypothetical protein